MLNKDRLDKVLAVAINPGAYEQEAVAAFHKARELVKRYPKLAFALPSGRYPLPGLIQQMRRLLKSRSAAFRSFGCLFC
jgi:hypothetical protein